MVKNNSRCKVEYNRGMVDKWRDNSLFQETNCSESRKFLIFLEKVYMFESLRFCGIDFQRSIALNEIILQTEWEMVSSSLHTFKQFSTRF